MKKIIEWSRMDYVTSTPTNMSTIEVGNGTFKKRSNKKKDPSESIAREYVTIEVNARMDKKIQEYESATKIVTASGKTIVRKCNNNK